jgi:hypothetical protein
VSDLNPPSPRKAQETGGYFAPHRDAFRRPIEPCTAELIDALILLNGGPIINSEVGIILSSGRGILATDGTDFTEGEKDF